MTLRDDHGVSLLEVVIAIAVLSIALVGLFQVLNQSLRDAGSQNDRLLALLVARNQAEELQAGLRSLPDTVILGGRTWLVERQGRAVDNGLSEVAITARPRRGGAGSEVVVWLGQDESG